MLKVPPATSKPQEDPCLHIVSVVLNVQLACDVIDETCCREFPMAAAKFGEVRPTPVTEHAIPAVDVADLCVTLVELPANTHPGRHCHLTMHARKSNGYYIHLVLTLFDKEFLLLFKVSFSFFFDVPCSTFCICVCPLFC